MLSLTRVKQYWKEDLVAGLSISGLVIPQSMAYALLAGLPPVYGLYTSLVPVILYSLFCSSQYTITGTFALTSLLLGKAVQSHIGEETMISSLMATASSNVSQEYINLAMQISFLAGMIQIGLGLIGVTRFTDTLLPHPLLSGFACASALHIGSSQMGNLLGLDIPHFKGYLALPRQWMHIATHIQETHLATAALGIGSILLICAIRLLNKYVQRYYDVVDGGQMASVLPIESTALLRERRVRTFRFPKIPDILVTIGSVTLLVHLFHLEDLGIIITGHIPGGLPSFSAGWIFTMDFKDLFPSALVLAIVGYVITISIGKLLASRVEETIVETRELYSLGFSSVVGAFFQSYLNTGSLTRSLIISSAGAKTPAASLWSAAVVGLVLVCLTPLFYHTPLVVLAAVILVACTGLLKEAKEVRRYWERSKVKLCLWILTFLTVVLVNVEIGLLSGMVMALVMTVYDYFFS
ncbi:sulfate transporter family-domain-containing protein [Piptocephalis cylindrospora]|uniref:Sulfate transporter family-domain-containing protein n=1 Tax=Piptocephalis cylindrospora TaxID=1907219 RepID=A0A4P9Y4U5_9FUNG|nr:sulfate transporter family-domain-containing protein [Piptocephalis cylindrospora]|eukprot:RKP13702.1 sulfate transporter family-domain-containing protein [Piptocephalis cylindrospora]